MRTVTAAQMREIDRRAAEEFGIPGIILMENAGRAVADAAEGFLSKHGGPSKKAITIVCGTGNNGGDGFVAARHLQSRGHAVSIILVKDQRPSTQDAQLNFEIALMLSIPVTVYSPSTTSFIGSSLIIDALLGTGITQNVSEPYTSLIKAMNAAGLPILAVDIPSGINADTGAVMGTAVRASLTVTLGLPKTGLAAVREYTGPVSVANISLPPQLTADTCR